MSVTMARNPAPKRGPVETCRKATGLAVREARIFFLTTRLCGPQKQPTRDNEKKNLFAATLSIAGVHKSLKI
jgi:hypothetical protein